MRLAIFNVSRRVWLAALLVGAVVGPMACSNRATPVPGKTCSIKSDCPGLLVCAFGKCHEACRENGDCTDGARCVYAPETGADADGAGAIPLRVCLLDDEATCVANSMCRSPLVCGRDLQCRQECAEPIDCPTRGDLCVIATPAGEKVCAHPPEVNLTTGEIAGDGGIMSLPADGGADAGMGGGHGDGGNVRDASPDVASDAPSDAPSDTPSAGSADGSSEARADASSYDAPSDTPVFPDAGADTGAAIGHEMEPNDDRTIPTPYTIGTQVTASLGAGDGSSDAVDFFVVTAPAGDVSGGYFQGSVTEVGNGYVHVQVLSTTDNTAFVSADGANVGGSTFFWWAAHPGQVYLVRMAGIGNPPPSYKYTLKIDYTKVDDPREPNDTRDQPAMIDLGTPVSAYFFSGFTSAAVPAADQDWYVVQLAAGTTKVSIASVPIDVRLQFAVYDANFAPVPATGAAGPGMGASFTGSFTVANPGLYRIQVSAATFSIGASAAEGATTTPPEHVTLPYLITVSQP